MGTGFNVNVGELRLHANSVANVAVQVRTTSSNATDSVSGGAFGQIGQSFASQITQVCNEVREIIARASDTVSQMESGLQQTADLYQHHDEAQQRRYQLTVTVTGGNDQ